MSTRARATSMRAVRHGQQRTQLARILGWLYGAGEQGIAVPDLTPGNGYLFQDSAGITPVTAYEQPVGLILDRSKGLVPGTNIVVNGDFASASGWLLPGNWSIGGGVATASGGGAGYIYRTLTALSGYRLFLVTFDVVSVTTGSVRAYLHNGTSAVFTPSASAAGSYSFLLPHTNANELGFLASTFNGSVDNLVIRELPGNHLIQATSTKRPTLSARYNLLTYSEDFSNAAWIKAGNAPVVTSSATIAPNGTLTADLISISRTLTTGLSFVAQRIISDGTAQKRSIWLKARTASDVGKILDTWTFDGTVANRFAVTLTADWVQYVLPDASLNPGANREFIAFGFLDNGSLSPNTGTVEFYAWGADVRRTIDTIGQPAYQRVGAATDYDTAGFFPYLRFDGTDDSMATAASVDFTATDKMTVFAGVTKLSDAAATAFFELTNNPNDLNGTITFLAPGGNGSPTYDYYSKGSGTQRGVIGSGFASPRSNVIAVESDISAPYVKIRVNGSQITQNTLSQGTGNYSNAPLFIGARNNASLFFNGRLYPFFVRGAATDAGTIVQTEQFLKTRMPVNF